MLLKSKPMKKETETKCRQVINDNVCNGGLFKVQISKLEESLEHRVYKCDKCSVSYKFTD